MHGIGHAAGDVLHGGGKVLLEVNGVIEQAIVPVDLLLLRDDLLLKCGGKKLQFSMPGNGWATVNYKP